MNDSQAALFGALALTGLAGSLHCVGMCGPILIGLSRKLPESRSFLSSAAAYHLGRLWTYALLGWIAGTFGHRLGQAGGSRQFFAVALGLAVVINGALLLRRSRSRFESWVAARFSAILRGIAAAGGSSDRRGFLGRVLVGAVMGLTPCGMVWMALVPAAAIGHPALSALGMVCFGVGTLPALSSVVLADRLLASRFRRHGRTIAAVALILAGIWLFVRGLPTESPAGQHSHHAHQQG